MDDGIFWFFYVIVEAIPKLPSSHTFSKFMLFALLVITGYLNFLYFEKG